MNRRICDYCGEAYPKHSIKLTRTPNGEVVYMEICGHCLGDINIYLTQLKEKVEK
jgi:hypothetical protein